jgi:ABC-2 type transport system permease protein
LRLSARRGENLLVTAVIPAAVLLFFSAVPVLAIEGRAVDFLLPGALALAVIASSLVSLGIATAYERHYGVLKRLGGSPLTRADLVAAKVGAVLAIELAQVAVLVAIAAGLLGWAPAHGASILLGGAVLVFGTAAFAGLGLLLAGTLRAEATLAVANGLFIGFLLIGGMVVPVDHLPGPLATLAGILPAAALTDAFGAALGGTADVARPLAVLGGWVIVAVAATVRTFRWE